MPSVTGIARQQWRARIETTAHALRGELEAASPASNGGRGLKQSFLASCLERAAHRPPAMAGAD